MEQPLCLIFQLSTLKKTTWIVSYNLVSYLLFIVHVATNSQVEVLVQNIRRFPGKIRNWRLCSEVEIANREADHSPLVGGRFNKQENLFIRLVSCICKTDFCIFAFANSSTMWHTPRTLVEVSKMASILGTDTWMESKTCWILNSPQSFAMSYLAFLPAIPSCWKHNGQGVQYPIGSVLLPPICIICWLPFLLFPLGIYP